MSEKNYVVNVKTKLGTIFTVRADSAPELAGNINAVIQGGVEHIVASLEGALLGASGINEAVGTVAAAFPGATVVAQSPAPTYQQPAQAAPAAAQPGAPMCKHGAMQWVDPANKPWKGWFCPQPKEATDKCAPQFVKG